MMTSSFRKTKERGVNAIAAVLMIIAIFLVIGFSIGALSTMNLNLSGRSINVVKANKIAEAAVAEFLYYVDERTYWHNQDVAINNPVAPSLKLDEHYNGATQILPGLAEFKGEECACDVHFNPEGDYYSTDNSRNEKEVTGPRGKVPPYTIEMIITVTVGSFVKHYQVFINRKWEYAIFMENAPVILINRISESGTIDYNSWCEVRGNIMTLFKPPEDGATERILSIVEHSDFFINLNVPGKTYPASIYVGCEYYKKVIDDYGPPEVSHIETIGRSTGNRWIGQGLFGYPDPAKDNPGMDVYIYPGNSKTKGINKYRLPSRSPFDFITFMSITGSRNRINEITCAGSLYRVEDYNGVGGPLPVDPLTITYFADEGPSPAQVAQVDAYNASYLLFREEVQNSHREVLFLGKGLALSGTSSSSYQWDKETSVFVVETEDGLSLPLVDQYQHYFVDFIVQKAPPKTGHVLVTDRYEVAITQSSEAIADGKNELKLYDCALITRSNIELESGTHLQADNCLIQVGDFTDPTDTDFNIFSGDITAGEEVGIIIYCENFFCKTNGIINGNVLATNYFRSGNNITESSHVDTRCLRINGSVAVKGNFSCGSEVMDFGGLMASGFKINYDPAYNRFLNRFGPFKVICFRALD